MPRVDKDVFIYGTLAAQAFNEAQKPDSQLEATGAAPEDAGTVPPAMVCGQCGDSFTPGVDSDAGYGCCGVCVRAGSSPFSEITELELQNLGSQQTVDQLTRAFDEVDATGASVGAFGSPGMNALVERYRQKVRQPEDAGATALSEGPRTRTGAPPALLDAPCLWCNYNGPGYWSRNTHDAACPWHGISGSTDRWMALADVIRERRSQPSPPRVLSREAVEALLRPKEARNASWNAALHAVLRLFPADAPAQDEPASLAREGAQTT